MERNRIFSDDLTNIIPTEERMPAIEWLAEQMPGGFFIYRADDSTELLYVNQSACDIFGCENVKEFRELTGNTFRGMVHPDDYDNIQNSIEDQIADASNDRNIDYVVYRIIRKDGVVRWVDDYGHFATLPGYGEVYYVFIEDITDTRIAAEEKERSRSLALALEQAEHANVAKSAFLSNMSHEIRTPITAILGMNEMIQREAEKPTILEYSENIRKAGVSLLGIISDILDFSKIETGRMELECEEYSLASVAGDLYNLIRFRTEAKGLDLIFKIDPELPRAMVGDEIKVKQIISNLLTNAAKYTEKGSVIFEIRLEELTDDSVRMEVSVTDTGIGIRKEDMERLFEPFDRLDLKKTRSIEGSGLGLAITRQLLDIMDSELKVESRYEEGSKFYFSLTQRIADKKPVGEIDLEEVIHDSAATRKKQTMFMAPGKKLLVVDDTPMNLQVIAGLLKRTRMQIDVAVSGAECIEKFGSNTYDLVFLDYRMPGMNGIETLAEIIRRYPGEYEKTPIISLTASAVSGDKEKMIKAGFTDYLSKPIDVEEMERMMVKYLPADSVIMVGDESDGEDDEISKLPDIIYDYPQLNPQKGMDYCGDADDYIFALETYELSVDTKAAQLEADIENDDIESFTINVHSLKSTSGAIGAESLFEKAKNLEQAGKNRDYNTIRRDMPFLLKEYRELKPILRKIINQYEMSESAAGTLEVVEEERSRMLAKALEEAERANMAKTAFLSNMSHEIRIPMNSIIGLYNIALKKPDIDDDMRDILTKIGTSAKHLLSLINDILDISLIESGHSRLKNEEFQFGRMIEQINMMTEQQCDDKGIEYECSILGNMDDYYVGDDMKLKQMLINVLGNAAKYTDASGRVSFTARELERDDDMATVQFVVSDTGVGIDKSYLPKLFEPFTRESEDDGSEYGSTGLGLTITKNIVDMMCGRIEVHSQKWKGSEFIITIPLGICNNDVGESQFSTKGLKALIVDDDVTACEHAKMVLGRIGADADYVTCGRDALDRMEASMSTNKPYSILLIDWKMPEMDGIELTRAIRSRYEEDITIILTTYNWDDIMEEALDAGVDAFLAKPLFAGNIRQEINDIMTDRRRGDYRKPSGKAVLAGLKVLLAEDLDINAQIMKQVLAMRDIKTDIAVNGNKAIELFERQGEGYYDAILMDIKMPELNGLEAAAKIRGMVSDYAKNIPIIALTANSFDEDVQMSIESGMNAHLTKPIEPDALFAVLEKQVNQG